MKKYTKILLILFLLPIFLLKAYSYQNFDGKYQYDEFNSTQGKNTQISSYNSEVLFVIDYSGSMADTMQGRRKIDLSIEAIKNILSTADDNTKVGLRIFGMTDKPAIRSIKKGSGYMEIEVNKENFCTASSLVLPISKYNESNFSNRLSKLVPRGSTPIEYALKLAVKNDFSPITEMKHIILITDGGENCGGDPCLFIKKLMTTRNDYKINVIGITVDSNAYSQLSCIANAGNGEFYSVNRPDEFNIKFKQAFDSHVKPKVMENPANKLNPDDFKIRYRNYIFEFHK